MPATTTLALIRAQVRQRADMVNSTFCTDSELNSYINGSYYELYDLLVQKFGSDYYVATPQTITTDGTNDQYALTTSTIYKVLGVDLRVAGTNDYVNVPRFNFADRNRYTPPASPASAGSSNLRYRLHGEYIWFSPLPTSGLTLRVWYVPRLTALSADGDAVDGVSGWEEYVIVDAVIKAKLKEESDASAEMAQKAALIARIESAAENRDAGSPQTVVDVYQDSWLEAEGDY